MDQRKEALEIFSAGVDSVLPDNLINNHISFNDSVLTCQDVNCRLTDYHHIYLIGFGKASAGMAHGMEELLGDRITGGHIITKYGHSFQLKHITITEAGHPVPDENGLIGTKKILEVIKKASSGDLIIVLISGGGSSLLTDLPDGISLEDLATVNRLLVNSGADIQAINCVRKHLSQLKGGQLAKLAYPASMLTLILSDVIGDLPEIIASGPTVADPSTFRDALDVVQRYQLQSHLPASVINYLLKGETGFLPETAKFDDPCFRLTRNVLLGNNLTALINARSKAEEFGYDSTIVSNKVSGDVQKVADYILSEIKTIARNSHGSKYALLFGGEPTVQPTGNGKGGRNQHLTLLMSQKLAGIPGITFLSAGTDGSDGPTDATGAICDGTTILQAIRMGCDPNEMTKNFDSYHFFETTGGLIKTGPTCTNVMDLMIALIDKRLVDQE